MVWVCTWSKKKNQTIHLFLFLRLQLYLHHHQDLSRDGKSSSGVSIHAMHTVHDLYQTIYFSLGDMRLHALLNVAWLWAETAATFIITNAILKSCLAGHLRVNCCDLELRLLFNGNFFYRYRTITKLLSRIPCTCCMVTPDAQCSLNPLSRTLTKTELLHQIKSAVGMTTCMVFYCSHAGIFYFIFFYLWHAIIGSLPIIVMYVSDMGRFKSAVFSCYKRLNCDGCRLRGKRDLTGVMHVTFESIQPLSLIRCP